MIYDGRNTAMAKCYNSIKHLVKNFPLISFTGKTNSRTHPQNPNRNVVTQTQGGLVVFIQRTQLRPLGVVQFKY